MSSRGFSVDLIHSIGEKTALTDHIEELIIAGEDIEDNSKILQELLTSRREQMSYLLEQAKTPNPKYWCAFKHAVKSFTLDTEIYEATLTEASLEQLKKSADNLAMVTSKLLGMEFETCARCFNDQLLVKQYEEKDANISDINA